MTIGTNNALFEVTFLFLDIFQVVFTLLIPLIVTLISDDHQEGFCVEIFIVTFSLQFFNGSCYKLLATHGKLHESLFHH